jgi:hypothetical protein
MMKTLHRKLDAALDLLSWITIVTLSQFPIYVETSPLLPISFDVDNSALFFL